VQLHSSHTASVVFARKPDVTWPFCLDYLGLNTITQPLSHVEQLVYKTEGACFFSKLELKSAYMQFSISVEDQFKTSFLVPVSQYEFLVGAFCLHGMS
jgi:hypothetical protein